MGSREASGSTSDPREAGSGMQSVWRGAGTQVILRITAILIATTLAGGSDWPESPSETLYFLKRILAPTLMKALKGAQSTHDKQE